MNDEEGLIDAREGRGRRRSSRNTPLIIGGVILGLILLGLLLWFLLGGAANGGGSSGSNCVKTLDSDAFWGIQLEDAANFDGYWAMMLLQKWPGIDMRGTVINKAFGSVGPSVNVYYNTYDWFGNHHAFVVPGTYYEPLEVNAGHFPTFGQSDLTGGCAAGSCNGTFVDDDTNSACLANPSGPREGQIAQRLYKGYVPPLWEDNGSTLYGAVGLVPINKNASRQYRSVNCAIEPFVPAHDKLHQTIADAIAVGKKVIIFQTGPQTDLAFYYLKYKHTQAAGIQTVVVMGGGFYNFNNPADSTNQRWAGNTFNSILFYLNGSDPIPPGYPISPLEWATKPRFTTYAEYNVMTSPESTQIVADWLFNATYQSWWVPTDATDPLQIGSSLDSLSASPTPEGLLVNAIHEGLQNFEAGAFPFVIRLWDVIAAEVVINPAIILTSTRGRITVNTLTNADLDNLKQVACVGTPSLTGFNPYDVLTFDPQVGQTTIDVNDVGSINVVLSINKTLVIQEILAQFNSTTNMACSPLNYAA